MQLVDLIVLACAVTSPKACHHYHIVFPWAGSLRQCALQAEVRLEPWSERHPNLQIERWQCAWPGQEPENSGIHPDHHTTMADRFAAQSALRPAKESMP